MFVKYKDGEEEWVDSSDDRTMSFWDECCFVELKDGTDFKEEHLEKQLKKANAIITEIVEDGNLEVIGNIHENGDLLENK